MKNVRVFRDRFGVVTVYFGPHVRFICDEAGDYADFEAWERWMDGIARSTCPEDDGFWAWWDSAGAIERIELYGLWPDYRPTMLERMYARLACWWLRLTGVAELKRKPRHD